MQEGYIGIDIGTHGLKGVVVDQEGNVIFSATETYPTHRPAVGWQEQDPREWLLAYDRVIDQIVSSRQCSDIHFAAMGFTGQMHSLVVCDAHGRPLRPAILWSDTRSAQYGSWLQNAFGLEEVQNSTGNRPLSNFSLLRLLWIKDHEPEIYSQIHQIFVAKDWVRYQVTGVMATDVTDASGTLLFDVQQRSWALDWIQHLGIPREWLGEVHESLRFCGEMQRGPIALHGLPVVTGAGDQAASAVGTALRPDCDLGVSLGTSGVIFWPMKAFSRSPHPSVHAFCHAFPDGWHWMAVTQSAAASMEWYLKAFSTTQTLAELDEDASAVPVASEGLLFLPYLQGERAPLMNVHAQGVFMGIGPHHHSAHFVRSILEGVAYSLKHSWQVMNGGSTVFSSARIIVTGGGAKSRLWMQVLSDVFGQPLVVVQAPGAGVGAAWLARMATTHSMESLPLWSKRIVEPSVHVSKYQDTYHQYVSTAEYLNEMWKPK